MVVGLVKLPIIGAAGGAALKGAGLVAAISKSIKAATTFVGLSKLAIIPTLIAALAYFNYGLFDPENRPFTVDQVDKEYDFIIVGGGTAGSILANRLSEVANWKVLLLEAGGHETDISDVPILSLFLHKSKLDWKYKWVMVRLCACIGDLTTLILIIHCIFNFYYVTVFWCMHLRVSHPNLVIGVSVYVL